CGGKQMTEQWKPVLGVFEVSSKGRIRRTQAPHGRTRVGVILQPHIDSQGYYAVGLSVDGRHKTWRVHQLMAIAFYGQTPLHLNHKDGNKPNNCITNLEYTTPAENNKHAGRMNLLRYSERHHNCKLTDDQVRVIHKLRSEGWTSTQLGKQFLVSPRHIRKILS